MTEKEYWETVDAFTNVEPPGWKTFPPESWERERDRCASMSRAARAHMPLIVGMFDAWARAWKTRADLYAYATENRNAAAVSAVLTTTDTEEARRAFRLARAYQAEMDALIAQSWLESGK